MHRRIGSRAVRALPAWRVQTRRASPCRKQRRVPQRMPTEVMWARPPRSCRTRRSPDRSANGAPLGYAIAQLHGVYILAQSADGMVLVDMHAAHERIMYESMKKLLAGHTAQQQLLMPEIINVTPAQADIAEEPRSGICRARVCIDAFGAGSIGPAGHSHLAGRARPGRHRARRAVRSAGIRAIRGASRSRSITCSPPWRATPRCVRSAP